MRTRGTWTPTLLPLLLLVTSSFAKIKRSSISSTDPKRIDSEEVIIVENDADKKLIAYEIARDPTKINNQILSILDDTNYLQSETDRQPNLDQTAGQSRTVIINVEDENDLANLERALSLIEYEPQRIKAKTKRKIGETSTELNASEVTTGDNVGVSLPDAERTYDPPRSFQPRKNIYEPPIATQKFYLRPAPRSFDSYESGEFSPPVARKKPKNADHVTPSPINADKRLKNRFQPPSSTEASKFDNVVTAKSYSRIPAIDRKVKQVDSNKNDDTLATRTKRKRIKKRVNKKIEENEGSNDKSVKTVENTEAQKPRRFGPVAKYDIEPRPFSVRKVHPVTEESSSEKLDPKIEDTVLKTDRGFNRHLYARKKNNADTTRNQSSSRNVYERRVPRTNFKESSKEINTEETATTDGDRVEDYKGTPKSESFEIVKQGSVPAFNSYHNSDINTGLDENLRKNPLRQPLYLNGLNIPGKPDVDYKNFKTPIPSAAVPQTTLSPYLSSLTLHPIVTPTVTPNSNEDVTSLRFLKKIHGESDEEEKVAESVENYRKISPESEEIAEASSRESQRESKESYGKPGNRETQETSVEEVYRGRQSGRPVSHERENRNDNRGDESKHESSHEEVHQQNSKGEDGDDKGGEQKYEKGGSTEQDEEHHSMDGEKGKKGYKSWHEDDKANKGHHDKEQHSNYYDEKEGKEKQQDEEGGYHEEHHEGEQGEKKAEFDEKGEHEKGHSTKGQHFVHKKDEFEKKTEFFDEFHDEGDMEKDGEFYHEHDHESGGHEKSHHHDKKDHEENYGKKSEHAAGGHHEAKKGHKVEEGEMSEYDNGESYGKKQAYDDGKKWSYEQGDGGNKKS